MANNEYPKIGKRGNKIYVAWPVEENGVWYAANVLNSGYSPSWIYKYETFEEAKKFCDACNDYNGWTQEEVDRIIGKSMSNSMKEESYEKD